MLKANHIEYRQKDCFELCLQKIIIENCTCFYTQLPQYGKSSLPCFENKDFFCLSTKFTDSIMQLDKLCQLMCPLECSYVTYDLSMSSLTFPNKHFFDSLKYNTSEYNLENYTQTNLGLDIYFPLKQYTEIKETPKTT